MLLSSLYMHPRRLSRFTTNQGVSPHLGIPAAAVAANAAAAAARASAAAAAAVASVAAAVVIAAAAARGAAAAAVQSAAAATVVYVAAAAAASAAAAAAAVCLCVSAWVSLFLQSLCFFVLLCFLLLMPVHLLASLTPSIFSLFFFLCFLSFSSLPPFLLSFFLMGFGFRVCLCGCLLFVWFVICF